MGGRGGSSGVSAKMPKETFEFIESFPVLKGKPEDIKTANAIREKAADELIEYTLSFRDKRGYDVFGDEYLEAVQNGEKSEFIKRRTGRARKDKREEMASHMEENFHTLGKRIAALNVVFSHNSTRYWTHGSIDKMKKKIDGK